MGVKLSLMDHKFAFSNCKKFILLVFMASLITCATTDAQYCESFASHPCGSPYTVSSYYIVYPANLMNIVDCEHLELEIHNLDNHIEANPDGPNRTISPHSLKIVVRLGGIAHDSERDPDQEHCMSELRKIPIGSPIQVLSQSTLYSDELLQAGSRNLPVIVHLLTGTNVNHALIKRGFAVAEDSDGIDWWTECDYRLSEQEARKQQLGIWAEVIE